MDTHAPESSATLTPGKFAAKKAAIRRVLARRFGWRARNVSVYRPHQGKRECARRRRQMEKSRG